MSDKTFLIVDLSHLYHRSMFVARGGDILERVGMCLHIIIGSIKQAAKEYNADHTIVALEGKSWRKEFDTLYKANRTAKRALQTSKEQEEGNQFFAALREFQTFLKEKTNCTVLQHGSCEADDVIGYWIQKHPDDKHILISGDSDFYQLLAPNVTIYDGVNKKTITLDGVFDDKNKPIKNKKTKEPLVIDPEYVLFEKIVRGDSSDNIMSAFPGVRETKIRAVYDDRHKQGYSWCNFMGSRWTDHLGNEMVVGDRFKHNELLINLTKQPEKIKQMMAETLNTVYIENKNIPGSAIGFSFLKFCAKYNLEQISKNPNDIVDMLKKKLGPKE